MMPQTISTAIPTFIENSLQLKILESVLQSLSKQSVKPIEVIISDNSNNQDFIEKIQKIINSFNNLNIKYILNREYIGIAANSNFAVSTSSGDIIHILHQDDTLLNGNLYEEITDILCGNENLWIIAQGKVGNRVLDSKFDKNTKFGFNELGGPSSLFVRKANHIPFNIKYNMLVDVVNYHEYFLKMGLPFILKGINIDFGLHDFQYSKNYSSNKVKTELVNFIKEYNITSEEIKYSIGSVKREIYHLKLLILAAHFNQKITIFELFKFISIYYLKTTKRRIFN
jgi:glycosyltransferase involved in cell wall biosynthesis